MRRAPVLTLLWLAASSTGCTSCRPMSPPRPDAWMGDTPCVPTSMTLSPAFASIGGGVHSTYLEAPRFYLGAYRSASSTVGNGSIYELDRGAGMVERLRASLTRHIRTDGATAFGFETQLIELGSYDVSLTWYDLADDRELLRLRLRDRWGWGRDGACGVENGSAALTRDERSGAEYLWFWRYVGCPEDPEAASGAILRLHVFQEDGSETTPPEGVRHDVVPAHANWDWTTARSTPDGEQWHLVTSAGVAPGDEVIAVRAARFAIDGTLAALSPPLGFDPADVDVSDGRARVQSPWTALTSDGALLCHFTYRDAAGGRSSFFYRIEPDGSVGWRMVSPSGVLALAAVPGRGFKSYSTMLARHRDGIAALLTERTPEGDRYTLFVIEADGTLRFPGRGVPVIEDPSPLGGSELLHMAFTGDDESLFVVQATDPTVVVFRFDADDGAPTWPEDGVRIGGAGFDGINYRAWADGEGGAFVLYESLGGGQIQHVDALGRSLFHLRRTDCSFMGEIVTIDRPTDPLDAPSVDAGSLDAAPSIDAGSLDAAVEPDAGMDGG